MSRLQPYSRDASILSDLVRLIDFETATVGEAAPGCFLIPQLNFQFSVKSRENGHDIFIVRNRFPNRLQIISPGKVLGVLFSEILGKVFFRISDLEISSRYFHVNAEISDIQLPNDEIFTVIDSAEESDERCGFTGTHAPRSRLDLEMESRIAHSEYRLMITDGDKPPLHNIKTGSGLLTRVSMTQSRLGFKGIGLPAHLSEGSETERLSYLLQNAELFSQPTDLSLVDETDAVVLDEVALWISQFELPSAIDGSARQFKLREISTACKSFFWKHKASIMLRDDIFGGKPSSVEDVERVYREAFNDK